LLVDAGGGGRGDRDGGANNSPGPPWPAGSRCRLQACWLWACLPR